MPGRKNFFKEYYEKPKVEDIPIERFCEMPECMRAGDCKAPKSRDRIREHYWFCQDHAREYNNHWDYLEGMSPDDIEKEIRADTFWRRPAWKKNNLFKANLFEGEADAFGFFQDQKENVRGGAVKPSLPEDLSKALSVMNVRFPIALPELKKVYKTQVKQYHPDVNGGSKEAEEKLKSVNIAFRIIEEFLSNAKA